MRWRRHCEARPPTIRYAGHGVLGDAARVTLTDPADRDRAREAFRTLATSQINAVDIFAFEYSDEGGLIEARLTPMYLRNLSQQAADQSVEIVRRRIDPIGRAGLEIRRQGYDRIFVRAPRVADTELLRRSVGIVGQLTFHMVREVSPEEAAADRLPPGAMVAPPYPGFGNMAEVVDRRPRLTGEHLARANVSIDQHTNEPVLAFQLNNQGSRIFCRITRERTGQRFALLLDGQVLTAPTINEPICGGSGRISGNFTFESANDLAVVLNAGASPTALAIVKEGVLARE